MTREAKQTATKKKIDVTNVIMILLIIATLLFQLMGGTVVVNGESMNPTMADGEVYVLSKISGEAERKDIVVVEVPALNNKLLVKRVIAVAGDEIALRMNRIFVNGVLLNEEYVLEQDDYDSFITPTKQVVPEGHVYVMGDNRYNSSDSRDFGFISVDNIKGKVVGEALPSALAKLFTMFK